MQTKPDIWQEMKTILRRLVAINALNIASGVLLLLRPGKRATFFRSLGVQNIGWGAINIAIGLIGGQFSRRRAAKPDAHEPETQGRETRNFRRLLLVNAGLDVLYVLGGLTMTRRADQLAQETAARSAEGLADKAELLRGNGLGVMLQGGLLFVFDTIHAALLPVPDQAKEKE